MRANIKSELGTFMSEHDKYHCDHSDQNNVNNKYVAFSLFFI